MSNDGRITFRYSTAPAYRKVPVSGVWGGVMPDGNIIANFFVDAPEMPASVTHELTEGHVLGQEVSRERGGDAEPTFERAREVGVVLSPDKAKSFAQWLLSKAEEVEQAQAQEDEE